METWEPDLGLIKFIERDLDKKSNFFTGRVSFEGRRYSLGKIINEIREGSNVGKKVYYNYLGYLE